MVLKSKFRRTEFGFRLTDLLNQQEGGYALFEALVSVLLLSIGLVVVAQVFFKSVQSTTYQERMLYPAQHLAEELMKELEIRARTATLKKDFYESGTEGIFQYQIITSDWAMATGIQQVQVTVSWDYRGTEKAVTLTTLLPVEKRKKGKG